MYICLQAAMLVLALAQVCTTSEPQLKNDSYDLNNLHRLTKKANTTGTVKIRVHEVVAEMFMVVHWLCQKKSKKTH